MSLEDESEEDQEEDEGIDGEADEGIDDDVQEFDDAGILEEVDDNTNEDEGTDGENDIPNNSDMEFDARTEADDSAEEDDNDIFEGIVGILGVNEIDDNSAEPLEEVRIVTFFFHTHTRLYYRVIALSHKFYFGICKIDAFCAFLSDRR